MKLAEPSRMTRKEQRQLDGRRIDRDEIRDAGELFGTGVGDDVTDAQPCQRPGAGRAQLRHDQAAGFTVGLE